MATPSSIVTIQHDLNQSKPQAVSVVGGTAPKANDGTVPQANKITPKVVTDSKSSLSQSAPKVNAASVANAVSAVNAAANAVTGVRKQDVTATGAVPGPVKKVQVPVAASVPQPAKAVQPPAAAGAQEPVNMVQAPVTVSAPEPVQATAVNNVVPQTPSVKHAVPQAVPKPVGVRKSGTNAVNAQTPHVNDAVQPVNAQNTEAVVAQPKKPKQPKVTANGWAVTDISDEVPAVEAPAAAGAGKPSAIAEPAAVSPKPAPVSKNPAVVKSNAPMPLVVAAEENLLKPVAGVLRGIVSIVGGILNPAPKPRAVRANAGFISADSSSPKNIFAIGERKSQAPTFMEVDLYTDKADYWVGETINVTVTAVNNGSQATLDRYVLINDGTRFYYFDGSGFTTKVSSFRETYKAGEPKSKKIISYTVSDADPAATFTLYAGFTMAGTADIVSNVSSTTFKIKGGSSGEENKAPSITVASNFPASVKRGEAVTFTANWSDPNQGEKVKLLVCKTSGRAGENCRGEEWCTADYSPDNPKTCRKLIPEDMAAGNYDYFAFVCDDGGLCSDYKKGTFNVDAGQPPQNQPPSVTSVYSSPEPIPLNTNVTFTVNWSDPNQGDRVKTLICGTNALSGTNCSGAGQEWCSADYSSTSPSTCQKFFPPGSSPGTFSYYAFVCDDEGLCSQGKQGQINIIKSDTFSVSISPSEPQTRDSGVPATFTATASGGSGNYTYSWSILPGTNCDPISLSGSQYTVTCTNSGSGVITHQVSVTAWIGYLSTSASTTLTVNGGGSGENTKPTASFTINQNSGTVDVTEFKVDASASSDEQDSADKLRFRWQWESGGNFTDWADGKTATHTYASIGTKTITLEVKDSGGLIGTTFKTVEVLPKSTNTAPTAAFIVSPSSGVVNERQFIADASLSSDAQDKPEQLQVRWRWEDGISFTGWSNEKSATHTYSSEGTKTITLEVKDTGGLTATVSKNVDIYPKTDNQAPVACFEVNRDSGSTNTFFMFDARCTYDDRDSDEYLNYKWDWDADGKWDTTSTAASRKKPNMPMPTLAPWYKKYSAPGTYNVRLEVTDPNGLSDTASETITVVGGIPNSAPNACLEVDRDSGTTETHFHFDASCTYDYEDPEGILNARWDWEDDGTWDVGYNNNLRDSKKFPAGARTIRIEVKDSEGLTGQATVTITVTPPEQPKCSDIYVRTEDVSLEKGETVNEDWLYENYSNEKFYVDSLDIDYISGSQYFTAEKRPPYFDKEISAHGGAGYYLRIIGKNVYGTQSGAATVKVSGHFAGGTSCSVEKSFAVEVVDKESGTLPKCSDIYVNAENVTVNENETLTKTFYYRNNSKKPFYVDDIEAGRSSSGAYFEVSKGNNSSTIYAQGQANYSLTIRGNSISGGDKSGSAYVQVKGHFEGGKSCSYSEIGQKSFGVKVIDGGGGTGTGNCSQISIDTPGFQMSQGSYQHMSRAIHNNSSQKFYVGDVAIDAANSSLDISITNVSPPSSIGSSAQGSFGFDIKADNMQSDTQTQLNYRVRGSFEDGKECYYSNIEASENLTINGSGSSDEPSYTMGWFCKDSKHMAYRWADGSWTDELECLKGCYAGLCDASGAAGQTNKLTGSLSLDSDKQKNAQFYNVIATILESIFANPMTRKMVFEFSSRLVTIVAVWAINEVRIFLLPTPRWTEASYAHVDAYHGHEFAPLYIFAEKCPEILQSSASEHYYEPGEWNLSAFDPESGIYAVMDQYGVILTCKIPGHPPKGQPKDSPEEMRRKAAKEVQDMYNRGEIIHRVDFSRLVYVEFGTG